MDTHNNVIELLNDENWRSWKTDIKVLLKDRGCWEFITSKTPLEPDPGSSQREIREHNLRKDRAYTSIYNSISKDFRKIIADIEDGGEAYKALEAYFEPDTRARIISLYDEFFGMQYDPDTETIGLYCARMKMLITKLDATSQPPSDFFKAMQIIRYLPREYQGLVQQIYRWKDEDFKFDKIVKELIIEENRLKQSNKDFDSFEASRSEAFLTSPNNKSSTPTPISSKKVKPAKQIVCFKCGLKGHKSPQCKQIKNNTQKQNNTKSHSSYKPASYPRKNSNSLNSADQVELFLNSKEMPIDNRSWCIDSGATNHFTNNKSLLSNFRSSRDSNMVLAVGGSKCVIEGVGDVICFVGKGKGKVRIMLKNVLFSPILRRNLLSCSELEKEGLHFVGSLGKLQFFNSDWSPYFYAKRVNNLYIFKPMYKGSTKKFTKSNQKDSKKTSFNLETSDKSNAVLWHKRLCHVNFEAMCKTSKNSAVHGLPVFKGVNFECVPCRLAKSRRCSFKPIGKIRSRKPLELLHMDVCFVPTASLNGRKYFLTIIDDFSRRVTVFPMHNKSDVFACFKRFQARAERFLNRKVLCIRTDNGLEFCHKEFFAFLNKLGIKAERTNVYTPEMNGVAERYNLTALDGIKTMLKCSGLADRFWSEALLCHTYVWNRVVHKNFILTPFELYTGHKPSVQHFRHFGCKCYVGTPGQKRKKLDMRAKEGIMVGYAIHTKGYRIWLPSENTIVETKNVKFVDLDLPVITPSVVPDSESVMGPGNSGKFYSYVPDSMSQQSDTSDPQPELPSIENKGTNNVYENTAVITDVAAENVAWLGNNVIVLVSQPQEYIVVEQEVVVDSNVVQTAPVEAASNAPLTQLIAKENSEEYTEVAEESSSTVEDAKCWFRDSLITTAALSKLTSYVQSNSNSKIG